MTAETSAAQIVPGTAESVQAMRDQWDEDEAQLLADIGDLSDRIAHVKAAPGLYAPVVELASIFDALLALLRAEISR